MTDQVQTARSARDLIAAALSLVFSILFIWYSRNTGRSLRAYWAPFFLAIGALITLGGNVFHHPYPRTRLDRHAAGCLPAQHRP